MMFYKTKPKVVKAIQYNGENRDEIYRTFNLTAVDFHFNMIEKGDYAVINEGYLTILPEEDFNDKFETV